MHLISCVGQRAVALIMPIKAMLAHGIISTSDDSGIHTITLLYTDSPNIRKEMEISEGWLRGNLPNAQIRKHLFQHVEDLYERIAVTGEVSTDQRIFLSINPGMNWEIAFLSLCVPEQTVCVATDNNRLYLWPIQDDTKDAHSYDLPDLGLDEYNELDSEIKITEKEGINENLSNDVKKQLAKLHKGKSFAVAFLDKKKNHHAQFLRDHLAWVKEKNGRLYFLTDLCSRDRQTTAHKSSKLIDRYRRIKAISGVIRYSISVVTDDPKISERAKIDGHESITPQDIPKWLVRPTVINQKNFMPSGKIATKHDAAAKLSSPFKGLTALKSAVKPAMPQSITASESLSCATQKSDTGKSVPLHICLGDNPVPTIRAILADSHAPVHLWFDEKSRRIKYLANLIKESQPDRVIRLRETDHRGSNMMDQLRLEPDDLHINVTPGTKMQAIAMCAAARRMKGKVTLTTIHGKHIVSVLPPSERIMPCDELALNDLLKIQIPPYDNVPRVSDVSELSLWIMAALASGKLTPNMEFYRMRYGNRPAFEKNSVRSTVVRLTDKKEFRMMQDADSDGVWWEHVVADAIETAYPKNVYRQVTWNYPHTSSAMSELDVVFPADEHICVVSCKTGWNEHDTLPAASEAFARFGRMTLVFLAVPFINKKYSGQVIHDVMILTPEMLCNSQKLRDTIEAFALSRKTYSRGKP